jgi:hypothetical protein
MAVRKITISLEPELADDIAELARSAGSSISAWLADAAARKVQVERLGCFLDTWEAEDGDFSPAEFEAVERAWPGSR